MIYRKWYGLFHCNKSHIKTRNKYIHFSIVSPRTGRASNPRVFRQFRSQPIKIPTEGHLIVLLYPAPAPSQHTNTYQCNLRSTIVTMRECHISGCFVRQREEKNSLLNLTEQFTLISAKMLRFPNVSPIAVGP